MRVHVGPLIALLMLPGCHPDPPEAARDPSALRPAAQQTPTTPDKREPSDAFNARADALARDVEKSDRELAQVLDQSRVTDKAALEAARIHALAVVQPSANPSQTATRQVGDAPQTMEQRAEAMFGPTLSSTRTVLNRFYQGCDRYMQACEGKTTQGDWLMIVGDWRSSTGFSSYSAQTETSNATTPECRMLSVDVLTDEKTISVNLNTVADKAHSAGIWPGVMRDLYAKYGLEEAVSIVVK